MMRGTEGQKNPTSADVRRVIDAPDTDPADIEYWQQVLAHLESAESPGHERHRTAGVRSCNDIQLGAIPRPRTRHPASEGSRLTTPGFRPSL